MISYDARPLGIGGQHWSDSKLHDRIAFTLRSRCAPSHWIISIHKKFLLSPRISSLTLLHLHEKDAGQYRFSLLGKLNEPFFSGFPLSYFHILIVMQEEFNCAWLQKFVQSFPSPACWHIFTQPRIFVQIRRRKIILSTLLYLFSFLY